MVIAATHMGHYTDGKQRRQCARRRGDGARRQGLDLIVGGHSQNPVCMLAENQRNDAYVPGTPCAPDRQNGTWIVQAHEWGKYVGRADFEVRPAASRAAQVPAAAGQPQAHVSTAAKVAYGEAIPEDAGVRDFLQPFQDNGQARLTVPVGETVGVFDGDRARVRTQPTNLGRLIAARHARQDRRRCRAHERGGVRDSLPEGRITYRDVLKVQPFGNQVALVRLTGAELLSYLEAAARMTPGSGAFPQTAGVQMLIEGGQLKDAKVNGQADRPAARVPARDQQLHRQRRRRLSRSWSAIRATSTPASSTPRCCAPSSRAAARSRRPTIAPPPRRRWLRR